MQKKNRARRAGALRASEIAPGDFVEPVARLRPHLITFPWREEATRIGIAEWILTRRSSPGKNSEDIILQ